MYIEPRLEDDFYFKLIEKKTKDGTFTPGNANAGLPCYYLKGKTINDYPISERTPEICASLMDYNDCKFKDVPEESRTRAFFITMFYDKDVFEYIKHHIAHFDRDFFKDLIASNKHGVILDDTNCFKIMPLEFIDEEMCSLAMLQAKNWSNDGWFYDVAKRKPEALSATLWHLGARMYARMGKDGKNPFLEMTPDEVKDDAYYEEMCGCNYNCGMALSDAKGKITDSFPEGIVNPMFIFNVLFRDLGCISRFGEAALETEVTYSKWCGVVTEKAWQLAVNTNGRFIADIPLNEERIEFFLNHYAKNSSEYKYYFKDKYKRYLAEQKDPEALAKKDERVRDNLMMLSNITLGLSKLYAAVGLNPTDAVDDMSEATKMKSLSFLPIEYHGPVPEEYERTHDTEEYLALIYKALGIEIIREEDNFFYRVQLPEGWTLVREYYDYGLYDENGVCILIYRYFNKLYDKEAYVKNIEVDVDLTQSEDQTRTRRYKAKEDDDKK